LDRLPLRIGEIARVGGARLRAMTGGRRASRQRANKAAVPLRGETHGGPRPLHRPLPPRTDTLSASEDPLGLSPEDDLWPPANKTLSVSLQRMTYAPLRGREPFPEGWRNLGPCVSPPKAFGGEQEGSCDAGMLRFPYWLTDPCCEAEHRSPAGLRPPSLASAHNPSGKQEHTRTDDPWPRRGRSLCLSACRLVWRFPSPFWPVRKGTSFGPSWKDECTE